MKRWPVVFSMILALTACDNRSAEKIGKDAAKEKLDLIKGASDIVKQEGGAVAETAAQGVGNVLTGLGSGFDKSLFKVQIKMSEAIAPSSLAATRAQKMDPKPGQPAQGISVYLSSKDGYDGIVRAIAMSEEGEIGRTKATVKIDKGEAAYVDFVFDERVPLGIVEYYSLGGG